DQLLPLLPVGRSLRLSQASHALLPQWTFSSPMHALQRLVPANAGIIDERCWHLSTPERRPRRAWGPIPVSGGGGGIGQGAHRAHRMPSYFLHLEDEPGAADEAAESLRSNGAADSVKNSCRFFAHIDKSDSGQMMPDTKAAARELLLVYGALPIVYVIVGRLGLFLAPSPGYATVVFLPAGIAVAAAFMAGLATLPGTFIGSLMLNLWVAQAIGLELDGAHVAAAVVIAFASALQAATGGFLLRKSIGYPAPLDNPRDILLVLL